MSIATVTRTNHVQAAYVKVLSDFELCNWSEKVSVDKSVKTKIFFFRLIDAVGFELALLTLLTLFRTGIYENFN